MLRVSIGAPHQVIFVPSSTNLDKNMAKLSIGWSSSTDLHENLYRLFACSHVGQMLFAGNKYLLLKRITMHDRFVRQSKNSKTVFIYIFDKMAKISFSRGVETSPRNIYSLR